MSRSTVYTLILGGVLGFVVSIPFTTVDWRLTSILGILAGILWAWLMLNYRRTGWMILGGCLGTMLATVLWEVTWLNLLDGFGAILGTIGGIVLYWGLGWWEQRTGVK